VLICFGAIRSAGIERVTLALEWVHVVPQTGGPGVGLKRVLVRLAFSGAAKQDFQATAFHPRGRHQKLILHWEVQCDRRMVTFRDHFVFAFRGQKGV